MINTHYKNRYDKFIQRIIKSNRTIEGYDETHHIQPVCLKGTDDPANLVKLTLREHHLAHWLLWKAYPNYLPLSSAFLQMCNKNPMLNKDKFKPMPSRVYAQLKTEVYSSISQLMKDKVYVKDKDGNILVLTKEEYANQDEFKFHTTGRLVVYDSQENRFVSISTSEYHNNKKRYIPNVGAGTIDPFKCEYTFLDVESNEEVKMTKHTARNLNKAAGFKKFKQLINQNISCVDENGNDTIVSLHEYHGGNYTHKMKNKIFAFDTETNINVLITREEYLLNPNRYTTSTKGKVLAKGTDGKTILISKTEFEIGNFVGHTKGMISVYDKETQAYVQITKETFQSQKSRYQGPNKGKVNVIDKLTGIRKQIPKDEFDKTRYVGLGNKSFLFRARNKLTNKEKLINIYEWENIKSLYEVIDIEKFNKANTLK